MDDLVQIVSSTLSAAGRRVIESMRRKHFYRKELELGTEVGNLFPATTDVMNRSLRIQMVTPAPARSLHGNRVTALRWARLLRQLGHRVKITTQYQPTSTDLLIALHARRSASSIAEFADQYPAKPLD